MKPIIRVENLGKEYRIGRGQAPYATVRESLARAARAPLDRIRRGLRQGSAVHTSAPEDGPSNRFWSLKDIDFEVKSGEVVGIIGRNGAGKSTLLKILSRITEPTTGHVDLYGRVRSLLEVGTGFHHELTGRENIYLNGAILGMRRGEIVPKFDEIVEFAEVGKFLDTPVKHYSSGMYMRLAFSIAAHLEPEILLIDEVLAVGDAEFQKKCLGKLEAVGNRGRTVLFVSHSMPAVLRLCTRAILLEAGRNVADGKPEEVIRRHFDSRKDTPAERIWPLIQSAPGDHHARLRAVRVLDGQGQPTEAIDIRTPFAVEIDYHDLKGDLRLTAVLHFVNEDGITLFSTNDFNNRTWWERQRLSGTVRARCRLPGNFLAEGRIFVLAAVCSYKPDVVHALERDATSFLVVDRSDGDGVRGPFAGRWPGVMRPMLDWEVTTEGERK